MLWHTKRKTIFIKKVYFTAKIGAAKSVAQKILGSSKNRIGKYIRFNNKCVTTIQMIYFVGWGQTVKKFFNLNASN